MKLVPLGTIEIPLESTSQPSLTGLAAMMHPDPGTEVPGYYHRVPTVVRINRKRREAPEVNSPERQLGVREC